MIIFDKPIYSIIKEALFMAENRKIHDFAVKYCNLYLNPHTLERDVEDEFGEECFDLGFKMDCGNRFIEAFSDQAFYRNEELVKVIGHIDGAMLLGSAIFSHWRSVTHWEDYAYLLDDNNRPWFITALRRLAEITEE